jgi:hypothetical protein
MKKIILYCTAIFSLLAVSCDKTSENISTVTNFAVMELLGDPIEYAQSGLAYVDPGVNATIAGEVVDYETVGLVDTSTPGVYDLSYEVINDDGFPAKAFRTVFVYEDDGSIAGVYDGIRVGRTGGPILISTTSTAGTYSITDVLGGYYEYGVGYGRAYAAPGTLVISGTTITSSGGPNPFGGWSVSAGSINSPTTMSWTITYDVDTSFSFDVALTKTTP